MGSGNLDVFDKNGYFVNTPQSPITARVEPRPFYHLSPRQFLTITGNFDC